MLFLVNSFPIPNSNNSSKSRYEFWRWAQKKEDAKTIVSLYAKTGRGIIVVFNVKDNKHLHSLLNEWLKIMPANFEITSLISKDEALQFLSPINDTAIMG